MTVLRTKDSPETAGSTREEPSAGQAREPSRRVVSTESWPAEGGRVVCPAVFTGPGSSQSVVRSAPTGGRPNEQRTEN